MNELIRLIVERTGISEETARTAAETVLGYVKSKLPPGVAEHVDTVLGCTPAEATTGTTGETSGFAAGLKSMFGGQKT